MTMPFEGLKVVDLSDNLSGAFAARLFADFGAEVVLAEPPQGHGLRREPPFLDDQPGPERSVQHAYLNWNKYSRVFSNTEQLTELVAVADVLVTTLDPLAPLQRVIDCLPGTAVHLSITPHGLDGNLISPQQTINVHQTTDIVGNHIVGTRLSNPLDLLITDGR